MENDPASAAVLRRRLWAAVPGFAIFVFIALVATPHKWSEAWFFTGLGLVVSATFLEPHFSGPRPAIGNAVGGIAACIGAQKGALGGLWVALSVFFGVVLLAAVVAAVTPAGQLNAACKRFASRFGRASAVGTGVLSLIVLTDAQLHREGFMYFAAGAAVLVASVSFDWTALWLRLAGGRDVATVVGVVGPRMVLVASTSNKFDRGDRVTVTGDGDASALGKVAARMPHREGLRYQIALADEWTAICRKFPADVTLELANGGEA